MSQSNEQDLLREFERFDADKSGSIDEEEFAALLVALGVKFSPEQVQTAFLAIDVDGNRRIDFREFKGWWSKRAPAR